MGNRGTYLDVVFDKISAIGPCASLRFESRKKELKVSNFKILPNMRGRT